MTEFEQRVFEEPASERHAGDVWGGGRRMQRAAAPAPDADARAAGQAAAEPAADPPVAEPAADPAAHADREVARHAWLSGVPIDPAERQRVADDFRP